MKKTFLITFILLFSMSGFSQTIFGKWNSFDDETNEIESTIEVYKKNGKTYAKIVSIKDPERNVKGVVMASLYWE